MLKNYGYNVIDMGKDVPCEDIVNKAIETNAAVIGDVYKRQPITRMAGLFLVHRRRQQLLCCSHLEWMLSV